MRSKAAESRSPRRSQAGAGTPSSAPASNPPSSPLIKGDEHRTTISLTRRTARAGAPSPAPSFSRTDIEELKKRMERLEAELAALKGTPPPTKVGMDLYSPESIAEFKRAIRRWHIYNDRKPLESYLEKTGGKVPRTTEEGS